MLQEQQPLAHVLLSRGNAELLLRARACGAAICKNTRQEAASRNVASRRMKHLAIRKPQLVSPGLANDVTDTCLGHSDTRVRARASVRRGRRSARRNARLERHDDKLTTDSAGVRRFAVPKL